MTQEKSTLVSFADATIIRGAGASELGFLRGIYAAECLRPKRGKEDKYEPLWSRKAAIQSLIETAERVPTDDEARELRELSLEMWPMVDVLWRDTAPNHVMTEGKNLALDTFLAGSGYTVVGPYLGLISSVSYSTTAITDVGTQINGTNGWKEAGNANAPTYTGTRKTAAWSAASGGIKALSSALSFAITGSGTVKGAFLVYGSGAVNTVDSSAANTKLMSAGTFTGGDKTVANLDTLNVSYQLQF